MRASKVFSMLSRIAKLREQSLESISPAYRATYRVRLHCGCIMTEWVSKRLTKTFIDFSRHPTCKRSSHFTGTEYGWPQLADASKATILPCDASFERFDATGEIEPSAPRSPQDFESSGE